MKCPSMQTGTLYMLAATMPLLHSTDELAHPSVLLWTASFLAAGFGVWCWMTRRRSQTVSDSQVKSSKSTQLASA